MNKTKLAEKSIKFAVIELIAFFISIGFAGVMLFLYDKVTDHHILVIALIILLLTCATGALYLSLNTWPKPKVVIEYNNTGIFIHLIKEKNTFVPYCDIKNVFGNQSCGGHGHIYPFGTLIITTRNNRYKIGIIKDVLKVEEFLKQKIWQFNYPDN